MAENDQLPDAGDGPLVAWYGDDFTGAAAVMEVLEFAGLPAILFLETPDQTLLDRFSGRCGIGIASVARTRSPDWMRRELPAAFDALKRLNPGLLHYKVCSTLDSAPTVGSIGCALEIASEVVGFEVAPILVAAPQMRRYQCFGHLFAAAGDEVYRLDRHPVMARHPVTPMDESDVARHISRQSDRLEISNLSLEALAGRPVLPARQDKRRVAAATLDCVDAASEAAAGRLIWSSRHTNPFVVGSQGVEYALVRHWREAGALGAPPSFDGVGRDDRMVAVSGSVSPTTAGQIAWSRDNGFACIAFDAARLCGGPEDAEAEIARTVEAALAALDAGTPPLIHTAEGESDPAIERLKAAAARSGTPMSEVNQRIGNALGECLHRILTKSGARRAVISGGDTSGHATRKLGIFALSALAPTIPGAAIFRAHAEGAMDGLQLALKGGQMGSPDYFGWIRDGGGPR